MKNKDTTQEQLIEEFETLFQFDGVTYKGQRHWREDIKRNLVSNWLNTAFSKLLKAKGEEREVKVSQGIEPEHIVGCTKEERIEFEGYNRAVRDVLVMNGLPCGHIKLDLTPKEDE